MFYTLTCKWLLLTNLVDLQKQVDFKELIRYRCLQGHSSHEKLVFLKLSVKYAGQHLCAIGRFAWWLSYSDPFISVKCSN